MVCEKYPRERKTGRQSEITCDGIHEPELENSDFSRKPRDSGMSILQWGNT